MNPEQSGIENNFNYNYLLVQTILKMRDAQAEDDVKKYWVYFEYGIGLVISHLDFQLKGEIQKDYTILAAAFNRIMNSSINPETKKSLINGLKEDFANAHRFYIMQALNRVGVVKVEDEGIIDFESVDIDTMTKIVRDTSGQSVINATEKIEAKKTPPLVKPEMIMVYSGGKLVQMPKEDYDKFQASKDEDPIMMAEMPEDLEGDSESESEADESGPEEDTEPSAEDSESPEQEKPLFKKKWSLDNEV